MKSISGKEFGKVLESRVWTLLRVQGSHHIYGKTGQSERISVPVHGNQSLKTGLPKHLPKIADISESEL